MTPYFEQNIADFETAIKGGLLKNERVIVCISSTTGRANVIELRQEQNRCVRDTLMFYSQPDFTQRENITTMLNDVRTIAVGIVIFHRNKFVGNVFWGTIC